MSGPHGARIPRPAATSAGPSTRSGSPGSRRSRGQDDRHPAAVRSDPARSADRLHDHARLHHGPANAMTGPVRRRLVQPQTTSLRDRLFALRRRPRRRQRGSRRDRVRPRHRRRRARGGRSRCSSRSIPLPPARSEDAPGDCLGVLDGVRAGDRLDVIDGTTGLRQAGLLRFVAPLDWASGCPELSPAVRAAGCAS